MTKAVFPSHGAILERKRRNRARQEGRGLKRERMRFRILLTLFPVLQVAMALMQAGADVDVANCVSKRG